MKIGIVGRTGAGKSTLSVALSRLVEISDGQILIDGVNIASLGLDEHRRRITFITQDSVIFSGTVKYNIDPLDKHTDQELETVLLQAGLQDLFWA